MSLKLYGYWRSSATYRVRIALNLKQLDYEIIPVHLVQDGGQQHSKNYQGLNPAELVPTLYDDDEDIILNQSLAIIEYLDERYEQGTNLLPPHSLERARVRTLAYDIACDIQPLANLRVMNYIGEHYQLEQEGKFEWARHWMQKGMQGIEKRLQKTATDYCFGFDLSLADVCLIPQVYNANRVGLDMSAFPVIDRVYQNCISLPAFAKAIPENQPDAE
ncbi:maleylacetoacetate isomerase [Neptunicella sp. SCSIO 80796]|uniref:maleylacetoacetate isomerase n=1 Tax=Neptunicella plasticusilytica TaxID=3117012 RepID=UPI003A4D63BE